VVFPARAADDRRAPWVEDMSAQLAVS
jgi:hypothetical protein